MKKFISIASICLLVLWASPALAKTDVAKKPTFFTYAYEWVNLNLLTYKAESKVKVLDRYSSARIEEIKSVYTTSDHEQIALLTGRYSKLTARANEIMQNKNISSETASLVVQNELQRQKELSLIRQNATNEEVKKIITASQEDAVGEFNKTLKEENDTEEIQNFKNDVIASWRDPQGEIKADDEKATRVYAAGTKGEGANGVIIDAGQAKIIDDGQKLQIEYAPGTGPSSVVDSNKVKKWKIRQNDGTEIESYTSAGQVVIGQSGETKGNVVVNTVAGETTAGPGQVIIGGGGTSEKKTVIEEKLEIK